MTTSWKYQIQKVQQWPELNARGEKNYIARYYKFKLIEVFKKAEEWGIPPEAAEGIKKSKLREITPAASKAIADDDRARLELLFRIGRDWTVALIRGLLRKTPIPEIQTKEVVREDGNHYIIELTEKQFLAVRNTFEGRLYFNTVDDTADNPC